MGVGRGAEGVEERGAAYVTSTPYDNQRVATVSLTVVFVILACSERMQQITHITTYSYASDGGGGRTQHGRQAVEQLIWNDRQGKGLPEIDW